jgi:hypothetical protein
MKYTETHKNIVGAVKRSKNGLTREQITDKVHGYAGPTARAITSLEKQNILAKGDGNVYVVTEVGRTVKF